MYTPILHWSLMCAWPGQNINRSFKLLSLAVSGFCDYDNRNGKPVHCIFPDFLQQTESHYTHSSEHHFLDSSILGFLPISNVIQLICVKQNFLHLAQAFLFIICSFSHFITLFFAVKSVSLYKWFFWKNKSFSSGSLSAVSNDLTNLIPTFDIILLLSF